jgi:hypothetical protein
MFNERGGGDAAGADWRRRLKARISLRSHEEENGMDPCHNDLTGVYDDSRRVFCLSLMALTRHVVSDYRPRIDDRALTVAVMGMRADVARMHWPIGGAARHVASWCVRRCVCRVVRMGKSHCAVARADGCAIRLRQRPSRPEDRSWRARTSEGTDEFERHIINSKSSSTVWHDDDTCEQRSRCRGVHRARSFEWSYM